jgi:subtilisin family serine protease
MSLHRISASACITAALTSCLVFAAQTAFAQSRHGERVRDDLDRGRSHRPAELIIQFKATASEADIRRAMNRVQGTVSEEVARKSNRRDRKGDLLSIRTGQGRSLKDAMTQIEADDAVEFVEPNWTYTHQQVANPNDPAMAGSCTAPDAYNGNVRSHCLWGVLSATTSPANPYGSGALAALGAGAQCSSAVHVGVIDEGVMINHPDLSANIWVNSRDGTVDRRDNDGNGLIDDINGWNFDGRNRNVYGGSFDDHGSHVAGTIAARANNTAGGFGICPNAKIISAKFLGLLGGSTTNAIAAINYITNLKQRNPTMRIVATNNSWGGGGFSQGLADAITAAGQAGILFVVAAGNSNVNIDAAPSYPASYNLPNMITVAAINSAGSRASFSNYGATSVHIAAPGTNIYSTVPNARGQATYSYYAGTSMATPHVTGAAALYASMCPNATAAQIKDAILSAAKVNGNLTGLVQNARQLDVSSFVPGMVCPQ